jgi:hypothetical protein
MQQAAYENDGAVSLDLCCASGLQGRAHCDSRVFSSIPNFFDIIKRKDVKVKLIFCEEFGPKSSKIYSILSPPDDLCPI